MTSPVDPVDFTRTRAWLEDEVHNGLFTRGAQVAVHVDGALVFEAAVGDCGTGEPMTPDRVLRVYCTIKPVTTLAIARLVEAQELALDESLSSYFPDLPILEGVTLEQLLTHTAGLHRPMAVEMEMLPVDRRRAAMGTVRRDPGWRLGVNAAYSEWGAWHVLGWLLELLTGETLRDHLRQVVLDPLGLRSTWVGMTDDDYRAAVARLGVNVDMRNLGGFPMLFERSRRVCLETNPAHGGYTNARDLAQLYSAILDRLAGNAQPLPTAETLMQFCSPARPVVYDEVLDRECSYGLGFMTDLSQHAFGDRCSSSSFGHSGNVGSAFAFADPERALAVGAVFNGLVGHEAAFLRRRAFLNTLYRELDEFGSVPANDQANDPDVPARRRMRRPWGPRP